MLLLLLLPAAAASVISAGGAAALGLLLSNANNVLSVLALPPLLLGGMVLLLLLLLSGETLPIMVLLDDSLDTAGGAAPLMTLLELRCSWLATSADDTSSCMGIWGVLTCTAGGDVTGWSPAGSGTSCPRTSGMAGASVGPPPSSAVEATSFGAGE
jgi:hypothetical protein